MPTGGNLQAPDNTFQPVSEKPSCEDVDEDDRSSAVDKIFESSQNESIENAELAADAQLVVEVMEKVLRKANRGAALTTISE